MITDGIRNIHNYVRRNNDSSGNVAIRIVSALRNIRRFNRMLRFLRDSQWRSIGWHQEYQKKKLRRLLKFSAEKVPFYRQFLQIQGMTPEEAKLVDNLEIFPIITEADLRSNFNGFISERTGNDDFICMALSRRYSEKFYLPVDTDTYLEDKALVARHYENVGYRIGSPLICFVNEINGLENESFRIDKDSNRYYFSSNNLSRRNLADYCKKIKETNSGFIFGYPTSLEIFANYVLEWEIEMKFQGIITSGEVLTDSAREKIERAFNAKVYDFYHYSFPVLGMGQCHYCEGFHLFSEYCFLELVDFNGHQVRDTGKVGRLVVTNTSNYAFPLIRFDTGDLGIYDGSSCDCGRGLPKVVRRISGTKKELLIGADGGYVLPGALQELLSEAGYSSSKYQLIQETRNRFKLRLVRGPESKTDDIDRIKGKLRERLGDNSDVIIEPVNLIGGDRRKPKSIVREYDPE
jgi:phenylacetate-CoA ligase